MACVAASATDVAGAAVSAGDVAGEAVAAAVGAAGAASAAGAATAAGRSPSADATQLYEVANEASFFNLHFKIVHFTVF